MEGVAITGAGVVSSLGLSVEDYVGGLMAGRVAIGPAPWASEGEPSWWSVVGGFDPADWMDERVEAGTDLFAQFALAAAAQAVAAAGLDADLDPARTAVVHGTSMGGVRSLMKAQHRLERAGPQAIDRKTMIQVWPNMAAAQIAMRWGLHGPQLTVCTACASSIDALGTAASMIAAGRADVAIAGGTEGGISLAGGAPDGDFVPALYYGQTLYGMATAGPDPTRASLPFDRNRAGIVTGEGSCVLVLERAEHARARGADVLGYVRGYGSLADAYHPSSPDPSGAWEAEAMRLAQADAGVVPADVDAVVAHATGTPVGDTGEIRAINAVFGDRGDALAVASVKGHVGHSGAAAGAMGVVAGLAAVRDGRFAHTAGTRDVDPEARFRVVTGEPTALRVDVLQVNGFGFGGQDASLVVTRDDAGA